MRKLCLFVISVIIMVLPAPILGQELVRREPLNAECGDIIEGEFTETHERHYYYVDLEAGDSLQASATVLGEHLRIALTMGHVANPFIAISDPRGVIQSDGYLVLRIGRNPKLDSGVLSAGDQYNLRVNNHAWNGYGMGGSGGIGVYTVYIGCTLRDGTIIEPGDTIESSPNDDTPDTLSSTNLSLFDYLGLSEKIANGVIIPLQANAPNAGNIASGFDGVLGYSFSANAGQTMNLQIVKNSGNLNLGVVLLSADNQVAFQASLVSSNFILTEITIPASGDYTLGVFRIDLIPPDVPENTTFTLTTSLN